MKQKPLQLQISQLIDNMKAYKTLEEEYKILKTTNRRSLIQSKYITLNMLKKKIEYDKKDLSQRLCSSILEITYLCQNHQFHSRLTNLSVQEAKTVIPALFKLRGLEISILEIKEIPTFISEVQL